jgi:putative molybdopterin biosynthesis protein
LILLNAGSSAGAEDFSAKVVEKLGMLLVHGVAVRPGHPVILGMIAFDKLSSTTNTQSPISNPQSSIPIIGVPGYPVSTALTAEIFVEPLIARWLGRRPHESPVVTAHLTRKVTSPGGDDDFMRVAVGKVGDKILAAPLARGAGVITSLVRADGLVLLPRGVQGAEAGEQVTVHLYRSMVDLDRTLFCIGSHDMTLDLLAQFLAGQDRRLVSANASQESRQATRTAGRGRAGIRAIVPGARRGKRPRGIPPSRASPASSASTTRRGRSGRKVGPTKSA